jgi:aspartate aminotransferase
MPNLAVRTTRAVPSAIMAVAEKAKALKAAGRDIISFSIGVPNFLPGEHVYTAARDWLGKDSGQYGSNRGPDALLDAYLAHLQRNGIDGYTRKNIVVGMGAKFVLFNAMYALIDEGDEVVIPTPYWTSYADIAAILGAKTTLLQCGPEQNYKVSAAQVDAAISAKTKLFMFNNPSNPTGMVYQTAELAAIAKVLATKDCWIMSDDIYNQMIFDGVRLKHLIELEPSLRSRTIILDSLSKTYGMPGWRIGFMAGPEHLASALVALNSNHLTNVPEITIAAAIAALSGPQDIPIAKAKEFQGKRDEVMRCMDSIQGLICPKPQGAFYVFPNISFAFGKKHRDQTVKDDVDFCNQLLESKGLACVPGSAFGEPKGLRISYTCKAAELTEGLRRFKEFCDELV